MNIDDSRKLATMESLCVLFWTHIMECDLKKANKINRMLHKYFSSAPLIQIPFYLRKRFELHYLLESVVNASDDEYIDEEFQCQVFHELHVIFKEMNGSEKPRDTITHLKKSEVAFVKFREFRALIKKLSIPDATLADSLVVLSKEGFDEYFQHVLEVIYSCDCLFERFSFMREKQDLLTQEEFVEFLHKDFAGMDFHKDAQVGFLRTFARGLIFFHGFLGKPYHFIDENEHPVDIELKETEGTTEKIKITKGTIQIENSFSLSPKKQQSAPLTPTLNESSFENVEVEDEVDAPVVPSPNSRSRKIRRLLLNDSPIKESDKIVKPHGSLWHNDSFANHSTSSVLPAQKRQKWTDEETRDLVEGVKKYGSGNWALMRSDPKFGLSQRTNVQLKDRWRNLTKK